MPKRKGPPKRQGRPPTLRAERTALARWMEKNDMRSVDLRTKLLAIAESCGVIVDVVPPVKSLSDIALGRYQANVVVLFLIRHVTDGEVDLEHWVRDLYVGSPQGNSQDEKLDALGAAGVHASVCHPPSRVAGSST